MGAFVLMPFLSSLDASDIRVTVDDYKRISLALAANGTWTLAELRGVLTSLLVRNAEQESEFVNLFNCFFQAEAKREVPLSEINLERALLELRVRSEGRPVEKSIATRGPGTSDMRALRPKHRRVCIGIKAIKRFKVPLLKACAVAIIICSGLAVFQLLKSAKPFAPANGDGVSAGDAIAVTGIPWWEIMLLGALLIAIVLVASVVLQKMLKPRNHPGWDPAAPRHFRVKSTDHKRAPRFESAVLDRLADLIGYFDKERPSAILDVPASTDATARMAGMPALRYKRPKRLRTLVILEDCFSDLLATNPVSQELAEGMSKRGVDVLQGVFRGSPDYFHTGDGRTMWLADLETDQSGYVVLVFSDGKGLNRNRHRSMLRSLGTWSALAWMELKDPCFWDESASLLRRCGIRIYPATPFGVECAMSRFLTYRAGHISAWEDHGKWLGTPPMTGNLKAYVEDILRDALPWAQACSMIHPIAPNLADKLRRYVDPNLPPGRIERLLLLPGTDCTVSGLWFSDEVLALLRAGFFATWTDEKQMDVLRLIIAAVQAEEPEERRSLAHIKWEWTLERVRLDLEPDRAIERLAQLCKTPLWRSIIDYLGKLTVGAVATGRAGADSDILIPVRRPPGRTGLLTLRAILTAPSMGFDVRLPVGGMFATMGLLLAVYGWLTNGNAAAYEKSLSINLNLWWGIVLLGFGLILLLLAKFGRGRKAARAPVQ